MGLKVQISGIRLGFGCSVGCSGSRHKEVGSRSFFGCCTQGCSCIKSPPQNAHTIAGSDAVVLLA